MAELVPASARILVEAKVGEVRVSVPVEPEEIRIARSELEKWTDVRVDEPSVESAKRRKVAGGVVSVEKDIGERLDPEALIAPLTRNSN